MRLTRTYIEHYKINFYDYWQKQRKKDSFIKSIEYK